MKLGIDVETFLTEWAKENSEELIDSIDDFINDDNLTPEEKTRKVYTKTLDYIFYAISETIDENNKVIEKQLRRAGVNLP